jgi:hypothetical protein
MARQYGVKRRTSLVGCSVSRIKTMMASLIITWLVLLDQPRLRVYTLGRRFCSSGSFTHLIPVCSMHMSKRWGVKREHPMSIFWDTALLYRSKATDVLEEHRLHLQGGRVSEATDQNEAGSKQSSVPPDCGFTSA